MADRPTALIVGANRGIGLGGGREVLGRGWSGVAPARPPDRAEALHALSGAHPGQVELMPLDMNDPAGIDVFAAALRGRTLDLVLVNAGVAGPAHRSAGAATAEEIGALMFTNAIAPIRLSRLLADRIRRDTGVLAFTSSAMGSVSQNPGGHELYRASKAALNSLTRGLAHELGGRRLTVLTLHPGWVRTDMGGSDASLSPEHSVSGMMWIIDHATRRDTGKFFRWDGAEEPW